MDKLHLLR